MFFSDKCTQCGRCLNITTEDYDFVCYNNAKKICGKPYTSDDILKETIKDKAFYDNSGGGVTFSGGECMLQIDFLAEILKKCKENNINTAVDTAGCVPWQHFEKIMPYTDIFLYDIKTFDEQKHIQFTGVSNKTILQNLKKLFESNAKIIIRIPVIPDVNDNLEEMKNIKDFLKDYKPEKIELLPYHKLGEHKYDALGMDMIRFETIPDEKLKSFKELFEI